MKILVSNEDDDTAGGDLIAELPGVQVIRYDPNQAQLDDDQQAAEALIPPYRSSHRPLRLLPQLPHLRLVQLLTAGADEYSGDVPAEVLLVNARGAVAGPVSEWILSAVLTLYRQWPALVRFQDARTWAHRRVAADTLVGKRVLIIGAGAIGTATAEKFTALGARPTLVARTARAGVHAATELPDLLGQHDIVVLAVPLTSATERLVDSRFLAAMPTDAVLVNAARGRVVDTPALLDELALGRLRAALDVTDPEPLHETHPLWTSPGVIISPHMARTVPGTAELCYRVAAEQIRLVLDGQQPTNLVAERRTK
uniref:NAD(P)-dependent oxidoreductase n=1 Tax=Amycolatopsis sp. CA-290885 TaxID=3239925 RepID=UPI003F4993FB